MHDILIMLYKKRIGPGNDGKKLPSKEINRNITTSAYAIISILQK